MMNLLRAEHFLATYGSTDVRLSEVYDEDDMLRSVLATLFPDFEYPDFSHLTIGQVQKRYLANRQPLPT